VILLDTHVLVWLVADPARLSRRAASAIRRARANQGIGIAAISLWGSHAFRQVPRRPS
jgi:PIN domain nuclease of toxin-antitoxin system